jgi:hypothetical protein
MADLHRVSNLEFFGGSVEPGAASVPATPSQAVRRRALPVIGFVVAALVVGSGWVMLSRESRDDRAVVLPDTFAGLPAAETRLQFGEGAEWKKGLGETFGNRPIGGRAFGSVRPGPLVNLMVVRADSRDAADPALGRPPYTQIGKVSCTHTFQFGNGAAPGGEDRPPRRNDKMLLCWRAGDLLTVSALIFIGGQGVEQTAAQAIDAVWALQQ